MFYDDDMKYHKLWPGGPVYAGDPVTADSLVLADFAAGIPGSDACDLGCGSGILMLLLAASRPTLRLTGVELRASAAAECAENLRRNGLSGTCRVICSDLRVQPLPEECVDLAVSNPPYFPCGNGAVSPDTDRAVMRVESASLSELCAAAAAVLRPGGSFCLVHRTERRGEVLAALRGAGLSPVRLRLFCSRAGAEPRIFLCQARKEASNLLREEEPLFQFGPDGRETAEYRKICHWET